MRALGKALLLTAVLAGSFQAHAASNFSAVAANTKGQAIVLSNKTLVVKMKPAAAPVQAKVTCAKTVPYVTGIHAPPLPTASFPETRLFVSAKAGNKWYYVNLFSVGAPGAATAQTVVALGVRTSSSDTTNCGAGQVITTDAAGIAIYR